jgi:DNA modification methylase
VSKYKLHLGDCLAYMKTIPDNYVDAVVTDPPYGLKFMGKKWDYDVPTTEIWQECYRILKPGGHLLSFAGTRTYHRVVVRIEDAGFEIRDMIAWIYGQGFPKSHNVSKAIDKIAGAEREVISISNRGSGAQPNKLNNHAHGDTGIGYADGSGKEFEITAPATEEAKQWDGWGTALKPAIEPICLARKPLEGTVAENVLKYGTGAINIDGCRVEGEAVPINILEEWSGFGEKVRPDYIPTVNNKGRFPANVIHDGSEEVIAEFPDSVSTGGSGKASMKTAPNDIYGNYKEGYVSEHLGGLGDSGSNARFFYCAKASKKDRDEGLEDLEEQEKYQDFGLSNRMENGIVTNDRTNNQANKSRNNHPTVKPTMLMRYLCKLITPLNGIIIDPFMGSGSTGKAARLEGFPFIGCELDEGYFEIAKRRIANAVEIKEV